MTRCEHALVLRQKGASWERAAHGAGLASAEVARNYDWIQRHGYRPVSEDALAATVDALVEHEEPISARQLAEDMEYSRQYVTVALHELCRMGAARRVGHHRWVLA